MHIARQQFEKDHSSRYNAFFKVPFLDLVPRPIEAFELHSILKRGTFQKVEKSEREKYHQKS